jgi:hypothetical protein
LKDLCPEDKKKIGNLIKRLAEEKVEKEKLILRLPIISIIFFRIEQTKNDYEQKLKLFQAQEKPQQRT